MSADRELCAVLVALAPLDQRKWAYLNLSRRTFDAQGLLAEPLSSGERALVEVAASLWNTGTVDLGYLATTLDQRHLQAVIDATAIRAGRQLHSNTDLAVQRLTSSTTRTAQPGRHPAQPLPHTRHDQDRGHER